MLVALETYYSVDQFIQKFLALSFRENGKNKKISTTGTCISYQDMNALSSLTPNICLGNRWLLGHLGISDQSDFGPIIQFNRSTLALKCAIQYSLLPKLHVVLSFYIFPKKVSHQTRLSTTSMKPLGSKCELMADMQNR